MSTVHQTAVPSRYGVLQTFNADDENNFPRNKRNLASVLTVEFLEMTSDKRLLLSWREPGRCNYTEQRWSLQKALRTRVCAISGREIHEGEDIFCPVGKPMNHDKCIHSDAFEKALADSLLEESVF